MRVTKTNVATALNVALADVTQINNKQLFIVCNFRQNRTVLVSYKTIIGILFNNIWYITTEKFSVTTSKQTSQFICKASLPVERVSHDVLWYIINNGKLPAEENNEQN